MHKAVWFPTRLVVRYLNIIPDDKILDWSKLKAFADGKLKSNTTDNFCL